MTTSLNEKESLDLRPRHRTPHEETHRADRSSSPSHSVRRFSSGFQTRELP